jgi:hypothetical protein
MGFFSWMTSDTDESIMSRYSDYPVSTVYMLSPGGGKSHREDNYEGYGVFGGVDAFVHLAKTNLPAERLEGLDDDALRMVGCALEAGYYERTDDGTKHQIFHPGTDIIDPGITYHGVTYDVPIEAFGGRSANEMIRDGLLVERRFAIAYPLKFSKAADAVYEDLPPSRDCPCQGFFGRGEEEEDQMETLH